MPQLIIYLDEQTEERLKKYVQQEGVSQDQWIADLIRKKLASEWPEEIARLAGSWKEFPTLEEIRADLADDVTRETM